MSLLSPLVPAFPNNLTNGTPADASQVMADFNTLRNAVNNSLNATGATGGDQYVGLTTDARFNGTSVHDALTQLVDRQSLYTDTGSTNALVITPNPAMTALTAGQFFTFKCGNTTTSDAATINISGIGTVGIANFDGTLLLAGQLIAGSYYLAMTAGPATAIRVFNPSSASGTATLTATGDTTSPTLTLSYRISADQHTAQMTFGTGVSGTSNATTFTLTGMPSVLGPINTQAFYCSAEDNTASVIAFIQFTAGSTVIQLGKGGGTIGNFGALTAWTASGTKAFNNNTSTAGGFHSVTVNLS